MDEKLEDRLQRVEERLFEIAEGDDDKVALQAIKLLHARYPVKEEDPQNRIFQDLWLEPDERKTDEIEAD